MREILRPRGGPRDASESYEGDLRRRLGGVAERRLRRRESTESESESESEDSESESELDESESDESASDDDDSCSSIARRCSMISLGAF